MRERPLGLADVPRRPGRPLGPETRSPRRRCCAWSNATTRASSCAAGRRSAPASRSPTRSSWACSGSRARWRSRSSSRSCPSNHPNVTHVVRPSFAAARRRPVRPPAREPRRRARRDGYFDDVLIPWDRVFHVGDPDHAKFYPQRLFDWIHIETQIRHVVQRGDDRRPRRADHRGARARRRRRSWRRSSPT